MLHSLPGVTFRHARGTSGRTCAMSAWDGFAYNFLTMGVIFPWFYLWGPASFPGANLELAILITLLAQLPISLAYSFLATVLPVNGGDYVYQTRAFGKWGFVVVMSGFVIWILQWVALSGWLFGTLGLAPLFLTLGTELKSSRLCLLGLFAQTSWGIFIVSSSLAVFTTAFLIRGLKLYVKVQKYLFVFTVIAVICVLYVFYLHRFSLAGDLNSFVFQLDAVHRTWGGEEFVSSLMADVGRMGFNLRPAFSLLATLGVVPIVWTSLQWSSYSVEQNTEIAEADCFRTQLFMIVGSLIAVTVGLLALAHYERVAVSEQLMNALAAAYWPHKIEQTPRSVEFLRHVLQPFPSVIAMAVTKSVVLRLLIGLGFLSNAFQVTCNCFIGVTRILVAMSEDRMLPRRMALGNVDRLRHSPASAHWWYCAVSLPVIAGFSFIEKWNTVYALGVTFACGYVFVLTSLAATRLPSKKMRGLWMSSEIYWIPARVLKTIGYTGVVTGTLMVSAYLFLPELGLAELGPYLIVAAILLICYLVAKMMGFRAPISGKFIESAPREIPEFYGEGPPHN
jgi:amino acid transporter